MEEGTGPSSPRSVLGLLSAVFPHEPAEVVPPCTAGIELFSSDVLQASSGEMLATKGHELRSSRFSDLVVHCGRKVVPLDLHSEEAAPHSQSVIGHDGAVAILVHSSSDGEQDLLHRDCSHFVHHRCGCCL